MRAIVLGSGLNGFSNHFEVIESVSFRAVLNITFEALDGHERKFIWCSFKEETFLIISGRLHYYEGHNWDDLIAPIKYAIEEMGVKEIVVTSASGGIGKGIINGEWTCVQDVVSIPVVNLGGNRNFDSEVCKKKIRFERTNFMNLPNVTYAYHQGPSLGTNAEYKMLHYAGVDLVGMSMYPEFRYLKALEIVSHFISLPVCNYYPFESTEEPDFEEVIEISTASLPKLVDIFKQYLSTK